MSLLTERAAPPPVSPPAPSLERPEALNLAGRPFTNTRPVTRAAVVLWILGLLLLLGNVSLFWSYLADSQEKRAELSRMEAQVEKERRAVSQLEARLGNSDLDQQNKEVRFLNRQIAARTFSWSLLFDRLAAVMPDGVRLTHLAPSGLVDTKDTRDTVTAPVRVRDNRVTLTMNVEAKSDEAFLQFVDRLFAHPFEEPNFSRESREGEEELLKYDVSVLYLPAGSSGPSRQPIVEEKPEAPAAAAPRTPAHPAKPGPEGDE
jgi:Tfp pilus assembly protein PilN